jgi:hypothetical protein
MGEMRNAYKILVRKREGKRPLGRPRRIWEHNIRMYFMEIWREGMDWMQLSDNKKKWQVFVNRVMNFRVPWGGGGGGIP